MSERKNIDRLFQEKFKDFEANPAEDLWADIEARLDDKKRKRVIPFWWKAAGIAAVFLIGILISRTVFGGSDAKPADPVIVDGNANQSVKENHGVTSEEHGAKNGMIPNADDPNGGVSEKDKGNSSAPAQNAPNAIIVEKLAPSNSKEIEKLRNTDGKTKLSPRSGNDERIVSEHKLPSGNTLKNKSASKVTIMSENQKSLEKSNEGLVNNQLNKSHVDNNAVVENDTDKNKTVDVSPAVINKNISLDGLKGENNSKIATKEVENKLNDTTKNSVAENSLEELLKEKESKLKQESKLNRWQLTSNVAPVFLGSMSNGSPIDSTLVNNSKSYNTGVGYGLGVSYAVNKKLTIRTGLNKFNMSYNTNDILYFAGIESRTLKNINPTAAGALIQIETQASNPAPSFSEAALLPFEDSFVHKNKGYINQEMGYLEMPVEMTYALLDKKFGIKLIGGFSTLFLQDNEVTVVSDNRSTYLGEASNLNDVHFSTNFGIGLKYGFLKSFEINVEPTFKYQLNTFSGDAGNFKPYVFGIYSGVSYKF